MLLFKSLVHEIQTKNSYDPYKKYSLVLKFNTPQHSEGLFYINVSIPKLKVQGYYKRIRHIQRHVVSKPLAQCTHNLRSRVEDRVFVPPLPVSLNELKQCITTAVASVDEDMLRSVWTELDYLFDICHVTKGSHIEHL